jgi:hypothetical protein
MKVTIDIDCSPQEARAFFGLPDVAPLQAAMMQEIERRMRANVEAMDLETLMKTWLPTGMGDPEHFQKMFWGRLGQMGQMAGSTDKDES